MNFGHTKVTKLAHAFINDIPVAVLDGLCRSSGTVHTNPDLRLDMQGVTSDVPELLNLQVQINKGTKEKTLKRAAKEGSTTLAMAHCPASEAEWRRLGYSIDFIRDDLLATTSKNGKGIDVEMAALARALYEARCPTAKGCSTVDRKWKGKKGK